MQPEEAWADHLAPLRRIGRTLFGVLLRVGLVLPPLTATAFGAFHLGRLVVPPDDASALAADRAFASALSEGLLLAVILALATGSLRVLEALEVVLAPERSYARKLAQGAIVGYAAFFLVYALLLQSQYARGLFEGEGVREGLARIGGGGTNVLGARSLSDLAGIALTFGLTGFARARKLPLREQSFLVGALVLGWMVLRLGEPLIFLSAFVGSAHQWRVADEVAFWIIAAVGALLAPALLAAGDALERAWTPRSLVPVTEWTP